jgi:Beta-lactamase enzyme family
MSFYISDEQVDQLGAEIIANTQQAFPGISSEQIALTWLVYDANAPINTGGAITGPDFWRYQPKGFGHHDQRRIYPASIVKLFYLVAAQEWLEKGMVNPSAEFDRALQDMVVDSSNDATSLVVDVLSGTNSGPALPPEPFKTWQHQRNIVNRYYQSLGWPELAEININQKPWCDGPYGREREFLGTLYNNRNMLTTAATARLLHSLVGGVAVSDSRSQSMLDLMQRDLKLAQVQPAPGEENQVESFLSAGLPLNSQAYSKAGWTSQVRHDACYAMMPNRPASVLIVFTEGHAQERQILPFIGQQWALALSKLPE